MTQERKKILEMVESKTVSVDDALRLLEQTEDKSTSSLITSKFIKIFILEEDKTKVDIKVPIGLAAVALKIIPQEQLKMNDHEINIEEILKLIEEGSQNKLIDIDTISNGKKVRVEISIGEAAPK